MSNKPAYTPKEIEEKLATKWVEEKTFASKALDTSKPKMHVLDMFPYPSGEGLHIGHAKVFTASDVYARYKRMQGYNVLHATGWDAFGLPAEQFALKHKVNPKISTEKNTNTFRRQMQMLGLSYDWDREINTTDPNFYKWTQWIFLKLWEKGMVKEVYEPINWCPSCKTGLANEDLEGNACERCGTIVEKKPLRQFSIEITKYADKLLEGLDTLDWRENVKDLERNWIGRSEGAEIDFILKSVNPFTADAELPQGKRTNLTFPIHAYNPELIETAKKNRNNPTVHEGLFWNLVEKDRLGYDFTRQKVIGNFIVDFFCNELQLVIEIDGGYHENEYERDEERQTYLESLGIKVLRFKNGEIDNLDIDNFQKILNDRYEQLLASGLGNVASLREAGQRPEGVSFTIFTTRPDTLFGCTYCVLAPEHALVSELLSKGEILNQEEVERYIEEVKLKTEIERSAEGKEKTGVKLQGVVAINPANNEEVPVFIADYVLASYGTGAIMAVPAHDERDFEFAKKYNIEVRPVIISAEKSYSFIMGTDKITQIDLEKIGCEVVEKTGDGFYKVNFAFDNIERYKDFIKENMSNGFWNEFSTQKGFYFIFKHKNGVVEEFELNKDTNNKIDEYGMTFNKLPIKEQPENVYNWLAKNSFYKNILMSSEYGRLINSGKFDGMESEEAKRAITEFVGGRMVSKYKLRDWVFARQRYWGEPFPLVHIIEKDENGKEVKKTYPVDESDLPIILPDVENYEPTGTGESPLANIDEWVNVKGYVTDKGTFKVLPFGEDLGGAKEGVIIINAKRETNTMPQWAGSSWYWLRYMDPKNSERFVGTDAEKYWGQVDMYLGGLEHATRHLIYGRFWHRFLYDIGELSTPEPFKRLEGVGLVLGEGGVKMSKRLGNVINPDDVAEMWGVDTLRTYILFMGPYHDSVAWNSQNLIGPRRFLERVWAMQFDLKDVIISTETEILLNQTIKKIGEDNELLRFNTGVSALMILFNALEKEGLNKENYITFLKLLAPYAPFMTEEIWNNLGGVGSIHKSTWPKYDEAKLQNSSVNIAFQINGKVRSIVEVANNASQEEVVDIVRNTAEYKKWVGENMVKKVIFVPNKIINLIV